MVFGLNYPLKEEDLNSDWQ